MITRPARLLRRATQLYPIGRPLIASNWHGQWLPGHESCMTMIVFVALREACRACIHSAARDAGQFNCCRSRRAWTRQEVIFWLCANHVCIRLPTQSCTTAAVHSCTTVDMAIPNCHSMESILAVLFKTCWVQYMLESQQCPGHLR